jgi:uncharacterized protein
MHATLARLVAMFAALVMLLAGPRPSVAEDTPPITRPVTDLTGLVPKDEVASIERRLLDHHAVTHVQLAVLLVRSTNGEPIDDYAHRVATAWAGGRKGEDKGALVVLAVDDRRSRIEVGYGLEAALPDAKARDLLDAAEPHLCAQAYGAAVGAIVDGMIAATGGAAASAKSDDPANVDSSSDDPVVDAACTGVVVFYLALLATALRVYPARRRHGEPSVVAKVFEALGALLGLAAGLGALAILGHAAVERPRFLGPMLLAALGGLVTARMVESFVDDESEERARTRATSTNFLLASFLVTFILATQVERPLVLWLGALASAVVIPLATAFFVGLTSRSKPTASSASAAAMPPSPGTHWGPATPTAADEMRWEHERDRRTFSWHESSTFSSSSDSSWSSSDSSWSSSSSDYGGGGGDFGGGGASSDW